MKKIAYLIKSNITEGEIIFAEWDEVSRNNKFERLSKIGGSPHMKEEVIVDVEKAEQEALAKLTKLDLLVIKPKCLDSKPDSREHDWNSYH